MSCWVTNAAIRKGLKHAGKPQQVFARVKVGLGEIMEWAKQEARLINAKWHTSADHGITWLSILTSRGVFGSGWHMVEYLYYLTE